MILKWRKYKCYRFSSLQFYKLSRLIQSMYFLIFSKSASYQQVSQKWKATQKRKPSQWVMEHSHSCQICHHVIHFKREEVHRKTQNILHTQIMKGCLNRLDIIRYYYLLCLIQQTFGIQTKGATWPVNACNLCKVSWHLNQYQFQTGNMGGRGTFLCKIRFA